MALSDREQQLLEQMERALIEEDPKFATSMRGGPGSARNRRRLAIGVGGVLLGLGIVLAGVTFQQVIIGAIGFAIMVGSVIFAMTEGKPDLKVVSETGEFQRPKKRGKAGKVKGSGPSFMEKLEERWDERRDKGQF